MSQNPQSTELVAQAAELDLFLQASPYGGQHLAPYSPEERFPQIWGSVALRREELGFGDGKPFVDCEPVGGLEAVEARLRVATLVTEEDKLAFWAANFRAPDYIRDIKGAVDERTGVSMDQYITDTWPQLAYHEPYDRGTLLGTRYPRFKPGERYSEGYYWDTADGLEGLMAEAQHNPNMWSRVFGELRNFADTIERTANSSLTGEGQEAGFIPNGMRSYYLSRSQPPKFAQMVRRFAESYDDGGRHHEIIEEFLPQIVKEYNWWMKGREQLDPRAGIRAADHVVMMPDGEIMNRYWDIKDTPRPESEKEDWETGQLVPEARRGAFNRNVRIVAESGRDMTGEYLDDPTRLETACAERMVPVDLNSILADTERMIAAAHDRAGRSVLANQFHEAAERRIAAILKYNVGNHGYPSAFKFRDTSFTEGEPTGYKSMNMAHPVARGLMPPEVAKNVCNILVTELLQRGGFVASLHHTGHQWDWPNGWAPDQEEGRNALLKTAELTGNEMWRMWANVASVRWVNQHGLVYRALGKLAEKCNVVEADPLNVQNGEYRLQFGFLWTNGILRKFMNTMVDCPTVFGFRSINVPSPLIVPR